MSNANAMVNVNEVPEYLRDAIGSNAGQENVSVDDLVIPRINLVQSLSPERDKKDPAYIEGIEEGQIFNSLTREVYGESTIVVPVMYRREYQVWNKKRTQGGSGFHGSYSTDAEAKAVLRTREAEKPDLAGKLEVVEVPVMFVMVINSNSHEQAVISFPRTKAKVARKWNSLIRLGGMAAYAKQYNLHSVEEKNDNGKFYNFGVSAAGFVSREVYQAAAEMYESVVAGKVKAASEADHEAEASADDGGEIPF